MTPKKKASLPPSTPARPAHSTVAKPAPTTPSAMTNGTDQKGATYPPRTTETITQKKKVDEVEGGFDIQLSDDSEPEVITETFYTEIPTWEYLI